MNSIVDLFAGQEDNSSMQDMYNYKYKMSIQYYTSFQVIKLENISRIRVYNTYVHPTLRIKKIFT